MLLRLCVFVPNEKKGSTIRKVIRICSDHDREFENISFTDFCASEEIKHEFSALITPQQNEVVERKNCTLQEMARVMMHANKAAPRFWAEAINTTCHIHNKIAIRLGSLCTNYELWRERKQTMKYFHVFDSPLYND